MKFLMALSWMMLGAAVVALVSGHDDALTLCVIALLLSVKADEMRRELERRQ